MAAKAKVAALPDVWAYATPEERDLLTLYATDPNKSPLSFREFIDAYSIEPFQWAEYATRLVDVLQLVADGYYKRVMVFAPPRLGKSFLTSQLFPAYYLYRYPQKWVALVSHTAELAQTLSRRTKDIYVNATGELRGDTGAVKHWETGANGGLWAVGVGGAATGKGADLAILDDVVKDAQDAASEVIQARDREWNDMVLNTRLQKHAAKVMIQTRWNMNDLAGFLLERERGDAPEHWHVVNFEAIKEPDGNYDWPATVTVEPDWRAVGENVSPERFTDTWLEQQRKANPYAWSAMYQQRPTPREGGMFKREWFQVVTSEPAPATVLASCRRWDHAGTEGGGDYTVGVKMVKTTGGVYYVTDVKRFQHAAGARDKMILQTALADREHARIQGIAPPIQIGAQEPGSAGKDGAAAFRRLLDGFSVLVVPETGDKETRATPLASAAFSVGQENSGRVKLVIAGWNEAFLAEMAAFPYGTHDDIVDAAAGAYNFLSAKQLPRTDLDSRTYKPFLR